MIIRKAVLKDLEFIKKLNHQQFVYELEFEKDLNLKWSYQEGDLYFRDKISGQDGVCFVAELDGKIIGCLAGGIREGESWLNLVRSEVENIFVDEEFRRKGVGRKLIQAFIEWSKDQKVNRVVINSFWKSSEAIKFYKKMGLVPYDMSLELTL